MRSIGPERIDETMAAIKRVEQESTLLKADLRALEAEQTSPQAAED